MTASVAPTSFRSAARRAYSWHPPLMTLAVATVVLTIVALAGYVFDSRELLGVPLWEKPLKFAISTFLYAVTFAWLISLLTRGRRFAWLVGTVSAVGLVIELVVIVGLQVAGQTSHFNVSTPFAAAMWAVMATSIAVVWVAALVVAFALLRAPLGDPARSLAIRAGVFIGVIGMALAFLMTSPTAQQLADYEGIVGAHAVGVPDGGAGLPLLGWSTVAGDLRIPHFVGMHALQLMPLGLLALELLARRVPLLRSVRLRRDLVAIATVAYLAVLGLLTWQALRGQSIAAPDGLTILATAASTAPVRRDGRRSRPRRMRHPRSRRRWPRRPAPPEHSQGSRMRAAQDGRGRTRPGPGGREMAFGDITKKAQQLLRDERVTKALKSEKAEGVSDKLLDGVAGAANKVTGGKHADKIDGARDAADKKIGDR